MQAESARQLVRATVRLAYWLLVFAILYYYLQYALRLFPWTRPLGERLLELFVDPLRTLGLGLVESLPDLLFLVVLPIVTRYLLGMIHAFFVAVEQGRVRLEDFDPEWAMTTYKLVRVFVLAFALVVAYPYIPGSDSTAFKGVSVLLGVLISIGHSLRLARTRQVIRLRRNLGHQRAIAVGLAYIEAHLPCRAVVVMDADGEDEPADVVRLPEELARSGDSEAIFARRARRTENVAFKFFYWLYRTLHLALTRSPVRVGNFSVLPYAFLRRIVVAEELWNHYSATVF